MWQTPSAKVAGIAPGAKEQMSLQFEDVVDCLQFHYPDFNFAFLFEHSQGHGRKCDGALHAMHMVLQTYHGGEQPIMSDFIKTKTEWFLGPHLPKLRCGNTQSMVFKPEDAGPCTISQMSRELHNAKAKCPRSCSQKLC